MYSDETVTHSWHYQILNADSHKWRHYIPFRSCIRYR